MKRQQETVVTEEEEKNKKKTREQEEEEDYFRATVVPLNLTLRRRLRRTRAYNVSWKVECSVGISARHT